MYDPEIHRLDFEQHFSQYDGFCAERCPETGEYLLAHIESHWATWLAARTTIVVKEPEPIVFELMPLMQGGYDAGLRKYGRVLSAMGIKVEKYNA